MARMIEKLLVVQGHDVRIRAMEKEMRDIPARKEAEQARLEEHKAALAELGGELKAKQAAVKELELECDARRQKIDKLAEVIVLALERGAHLVAVDEKLARQRLQSLGVEIVGVLGILLDSKRAGLLEKVRPEIDKLRKAKFTMSQTLIEIILDMASEFSG